MEQGSKPTASEQSNANGNDSTNSILSAIQSLRNDMTKQSSDMLEAINVFKTELMSHSKRIGEAEDRISQTEEDVTTLRQKAKKLEQMVETLTNKILDLVRSMDIRYGMLYPAHLIVTHADKRHIFKTVSEAEDFIRRLKIIT